MSHVGCVQAPEGTEHEAYKKGQHLRGADAANAERVRAEMVSAAVLLSTPYASALPAHNTRHSTQLVDSTCSTIALWICQTSANT